MLKVEHFRFFSFISSRFYMEFSVLIFLKKKRKIPSLRFISIHSQFFSFFLCAFFIFFGVKSLTIIFWVILFFIFHAFPRSDAFTSLEPYPNGFCSFFSSFLLNIYSKWIFIIFFFTFSSSIHHSFLLLFYLN